MSTFILLKGMLRSLNTEQKLNSHKSNKLNKRNPIEGIAGTSWLFNTSIIQIRWHCVLLSMWVGVAYV